MMTSPLVLWTESGRWVNDMGSRVHSTEASWCSTSISKRIATADD
jgi:hypothetical protein